jgi:hypothetical protein
VVGTVVVVGVVAVVVELGLKKFVTLFQAFFNVSKKAINLNNLLK